MQRVCEENEWGKVSKRIITLQVFGLVAVPGLGELVLLTNVDLHLYLVQLVACRLLGGLERKEGRSGST